VAGLVFGLPTIVMGATFSHVIGLVARVGVGRAYAVNTLGGALAPILFTLWIIPSNGYRDALFIVVYGYLLTFGVFTWFRRFKAKWQVGLILGVVVTTTLAPKDLVLVEPDDGWTVISRAETTMGLVIVSEKKDDAKLRRLQVGRHFRMGGAFAFGERRMGHIPLLLRPYASSALYLGVGTAATLGAVTTHPELERVDAVELVPAVVDALPHFGDINGKVHEDPRVTIHKADARRFVAASTQTWDVVVADLFHPGLDGAGGLYALEHFESVRDHLAPGGLFAQWVPLYQLDEPTLQTIIRTFLAAFPDAHAMLGVYNVQTPAIALIGRAEPLTIDPQQLTSMLAQPIYGELLMQEPRDLLGAYLLDRNALATFAGDGPLNTDLRPDVLFAAPRVAYEGESGRGWTNLLALWEHAAPISADILASDDPDTWHADAARFQTALHEYLLGERARIDEAESQVAPEIAVDHYLAAYEAAPDFAPGRGMLYVSASSSPDVARRVYPRMLERTPAEPRVYQAYLPFLQRSGDTERLREVQEMAKQNLAPKP
jgi:spermidine synthase